MDPRLKELDEAITAAIAGLQASQWNWHPPGKWCASEVLEHLYLTYTGTIKGFERVLTAGEPLATRPTWVQRGRSLVVLGLAYLPSGREAPSVARPRGTAHETVLAEVRSKIAAMDSILRQCEEKHGRGAKLLDHPILGPLTAGQWRKFHLVHGRHHVKQIQRLRRLSASAGSQPKGGGPQNAV